MNSSVYTISKPALALYEQHLHDMNISVYMIWKPSFTRYEYEHGQGHQKKKSNNTRQQNLVDRESSLISVKIKYSIKDSSELPFLNRLVLSSHAYANFFFSSLSEKKILWNKLIFLSIAKCQVIVHVSGNHIP